MNSEKVNAISPVKTLGDVQLQSVRLIYSPLPNEIVNDAGLCDGRLRTSGGK